MKQDYKVIIIGSGFGGQLAAMNLTKQGITDFLMLERREFMGGTWSQNVYPGAAVDVPSVLYSVAAEPYDWKQKYAERDELNAYTDHIINKHKLKEKTATNCTVTKIQWHDDSSRWNILVQGGEPFSAQYVVNASGPLSTPVIPNFKGRDTFKGKSFHSNNWDSSYNYQDKRVAVIGTGASAAQIIPAIVNDVKHLDVYQRTADWVIPRQDYVFKKWQRALLRNKLLYKAVRTFVYWALEFRLIGFKYSQNLLNLLGRGASLKHINKHIKDPVLRKKVTPNFAFGCKRIILSDTLYPAYARDHVDVYDKSNGVKEITEKGIITDDGAEHPVDLIVYSTGYDATDGVISYPVVGRHGVTLLDTWKEFPRAYLGTAAPGFPNLFVVTGPNTGIGHTSALFLIESQMCYIINSIKNVEKRNKKTVEVKDFAEERYTNHIHSEMQKTVWQSGGCNSWYKSKSGKVIAMFPGFSFTYRRWAKKFRMADHSFSD